MKELLEDSLLNPKYEGFIIKHLRKNASNPSDKFSGLKLTENY